MLDQLDTKVYPRLLRLELYTDGCLLLTERATQWFSTLEEGRVIGSKLLHPQWGDNPPAGNC